VSTGSLGRLKEAALHEYRSQRLAAQRDLARVYDRESSLHAVYRLIRRRDPPLARDRRARRLAGLSDLDIGIILYGNTITGVAGAPAVV
jgi:hypothetical protein